LLLSAVAAGRGCTIDIACPQGAKQQTRRPSLQLSIDGTDRQTDGRTDTAYCRIMCEQ